MRKVTFVTSNQNKADYLSKYLGFSVEHTKIELDEIQSLDLKEIVKHKVFQAYQKIKTPVIVEDVSLEFEALGSLPGPFIKYFVENMPLKNICALINGENRNATARCVIGYFDGVEIKLFEGSLTGRIAKVPGGENGFDWDKIYMPEGYSVTRAQLSEEDYKKTYLQIKPFEKLKVFLES